MRKKPIEVWVDLLCWESVLAILFSRKFRVRKIIYFQDSKLFTPFLFFFQIFTKIDLKKYLDDNLPILSKNIKYHKNLEIY